MYLYFLYLSKYFALINEYFHKDEDEKLLFEYVSSFSC